VISAKEDYFAPRVRPSDWGRTISETDSMWQRLKCAGFLHSMANMGLAYAEVVLPCRDRPEESRGD
jgi:hypothetical protein